MSKPFHKKPVDGGVANTCCALKWANNIGRSSRCELRTLAILMTCRRNSETDLMVAVHCVACQAKE